MKKLCLSILFVVASFSVSFAQDGERIKLEKEEIDRPVNNQVEVKKFRKALPAGYKSITKPEQQTQIYKIQEDYHSVIKLLQARIDALESERDKAIEAVLTPTQKDELDKAREKNKASRAKPKDVEEE
ncbi:MAG: hypothetical protein LBU65_02185 [Planctomycetaceae bacterium]|jgi:hypothetical protein|nr:hypothetical protein [Planctomycetaceae bacterium]